jgi:hypothetical protein
VYFVFRTKYSLGRFSRASARGRIFIASPSIPKPIPHKSLSALARDVSLVANVKLRGHQSARRHQNAPRQEVRPPRESQWGSPSAFSCQRASLAGPLFFCSGRKPVSPTHYLTDHPARPLQSAPNTRIRSWHSSKIPSRLGTRCYFVRRPWINALGK